MSGYVIANIDVKNPEAYKEIHDGTCVAPKIILIP